MSAHITLDDERSPKKALINVFLLLIFTLFFFLIISIFLFEAVHWFAFKDNEIQKHLFVHGDLSVLRNSLDVFAVYVNWWKALLHGFQTHQVRFILLLPLIAPMVSLYILYFISNRSSYSFNFWFILNHHFAKIKDIEKMGLHKGFLLVLGRFQDYVLGVTRASNVLCVGETGCGKTSSVAIPSILRSDNVNVLAIDNTGTLARHTSGHRAKIGKVFYFNWDKSDEIDKGIVYPKWNPLCIKNLPAENKEREEYLKKIASYLVASADEYGDESNYWYWLTQNTMSTLLLYLVAKISNAIANDYFLDAVLEKKILKKEDKEILLSYYLLMPECYIKDVVLKLKENAQISADDYVPIGSWGGIPDLWKGKDICLAMLTDWLLQNYFSIENSGNKDCREWMESIKVEADIFNYGNTVLQGIEQFLSLSRQQQQMIFVYLIKTLKIFVNQIIRDKTSINDFDVNNFKGIRNQETGEIEPVTVYVVANTKSSKVLSQIFMELMLEQGVIHKKAKGAFPLLVVLDDVGQMLKVKILSEAISKGIRCRTSFLLLCNGLNQIENTYTRDTLEDIIANSGYKIVLAEDNFKMSQQLSQLAVFATRSVQLPQDGSRPVLSNSYADTYYFHQLAKDFETKKDLHVKTRDYQVILAEGFYNRPILAKNIYFMKDDKFKDKAIKEACYGLSEQIVSLRNIQDNCPPTIDEVLGEIDLSIDSEKEFKQFMDLAYDEGKNAAINEVIVEDKVLEKNSVEKTDWWLEEQAFDIKGESKDQNPFVKKTVMK